MTSITQYYQYQLPDAGYESPVSHEGRVLHHAVHERLPERADVADHHRREVDLVQRRRQRLDANVDSGTVTS